MCRTYGITGVLRGGDPRRGTTHLDKTVYTDAEPDAELGGAAPAPFDGGEY